MSTYNSFILFEQEGGQLDLRAYAKTELHRHLEGALRFSTLIELAKAAGQEVPSDLAQQRQHFLVEAPMTDLTAVLGKFAATQALLKSEETLTRIAYEAVEDAFHEGIKILELRYAPTFIRQNHEYLSFEQIHRAILKGLKLAEKFPVATGLLCIFQRTLPMSESEKVLDFVIETKDTWVGVDLADDEVASPARNFKSIFRKVQKMGLPITIHAGEAKHPLSPQNVKDAVEILGAKRIGHGLQIINNLEVLNEIRDRKIPLELCPTSNWLTNAISSLDGHPIRKLIQAGVLVTINSDDPGIFGIDLTNEYILLQSKYNFTQAEFDRCNDIAAAASFIPFAQKQKFWPRKI